MTVISDWSYASGFDVNRTKLTDMIKMCASVTALSDRVCELTRVPRVKIPKWIDESLFPVPHKTVVGYAGTAQDNRNW